MDAVTRMLIEHACAKCSLEYADAVDSGDYDRLVEQFVEGAVLDLGIMRLEGRDAIRAAMSQRPENLMSKHVFPNILISVKSETYATGRTYLMLFRGDKSSLPNSPVPSPSAVGYYDDEYEVDDGVWRLRTRTLVAEFVDPSLFGG